MVDGFFQLPGITTGQNAGAAGAAFGIGGEGIGETHTFVGDAVKGGGFYPITAIDARVLA